MTPERGATNGTTKPSSEEVADILRERIRTGVLKTGAHMPTQAQLVQEFGVERGAIRKAVEHLKSEGMLTAVTRGAPPRIAGPPPVVVEADDDEPQQTAALLGPKILAAFGAPEVRIDALCLTAESLALALAEPLQRIRSGRLTPRSVKVRILLPDRHLDLAFPRPADDAEDAAQVHERWLHLRNIQGAAMRHHLLAMRSTRDLDVEVTFRALPFTPPVKIYLLNDTEALFAYYTVTRRPEQIDGNTVELFDVLGSDSTLFTFNGDGEARDGAFVAESSKWFEGLWTTVATDLNLEP
ncbi:GntR family transcriptional regulator [Streptomyces sp. NBC_00683]|uniref:winged helix-turn-helix domain-containing protein n=1 Tax=Streptomyces sp. NBC_00683 TaxID=2903670 RepID=UPI002E35B29C|nr:GntR family transcriptional regulator [Streptomyces sp. NBC_00683]